MRKENKPDKGLLQTLKATEKTELLLFLLDKHVRKSRNAIKSLLTHKQVKVNGKIVSQYNQELNPGDVVNIYQKNRAFDTKKLEGLSIVYEDEFLLVVDKEPGLLSIATDSEKRKTAYSIISEYLKQKNKEARVFVLHRLDRETSGLMLYAKSTDIQEIMQRNWDHLIRVRSYIAIVEGHLYPANGSIVSWLTEDKNYKMHSSATDNGGQKAITHYETVKSNRKFSMLKLKLETGRKNQIRIHMQHAGHPVVGDKKYGSKTSTIRRLALHAHELLFVHPGTNELMEFKSPVPAKMQMLVDSGTPQKTQE